MCMQSADKSLSKPKPLVIHFTRDVDTCNTLIYISIYY